jgi:hypothetical protein
LALDPTPVPKSTTPAKYARITFIVLPPLKDHFWLLNKRNKTAMSVACFF